MCNSIHRFIPQIGDPTFEIAGLFTGVLIAIAAAFGSAAALPFEAADLCLAFTDRRGDDAGGGANATRQQWKRERRSGDGHNLGTTHDGLPFKESSRNGSCRP
jgi:hypothetical protein